MQMSPGSLPFCLFFAAAEDFSEATGVFVAVVSAAKTTPWRIIKTSHVIVEISNALNIKRLFTENISSAGKITLVKPEWQ
jgi:hypothetical protein